MSDDETVSDRVAQTLREARNLPGVGDPSPWANAVPAARGAYLREADALLAAFPEIGLFERLGGWLLGDASLDRSAFIYTAIVDGFETCVVELDKEGKTAAVAIVNRNPAVALSAALDQAETQERER